MSVTCNRLLSTANERFKSVEYGDDKAIVTRENTQIVDLYEV